MEREVLNRGRPKAALPSGQQFRETFDTQNLRDQKQERHRISVAAVLL
jgi:hypothetical protein